nr:tetratricopeptide repeat protein [Ardenticatenales bacterium]
MDDALAVYLPMDRRHALATENPLPERTEGAALFADISGFTPLTEALTRELGPRRGAEELPRQLNIVYDTLIREVDCYGGSVIGFAGDAITCWFDQDSGLRATTCGLAMQAAMRIFATVELPSGSTAALAMKVAVAAGAMRRFLVGDPSVQLIDTLAGETLTRMAAAEHIAEKNEVVLEEHTAHALDDLLEIQGWRTDEHGARFAVVGGLRTAVAPQPWPPLLPDTLHPDALRPWILPIVYERLHAGQGEFLTELRPAVALFLRFDGIEYDSDPEACQRLDAFIRWVQSLLVRYEGTLIQLTIGEKGSYLYAAFGAPIAHEDDARRAALTALALCDLPEALSFIIEIQIGLTRGTMRTGAYGGTTRRTYGSLGDEVNLAARLMQHAQPGQIIASGRVQSATAALFRWQSLGDIYVKGKRDAIPVFALLGQPPASAIHLTEPTYTMPMIGRTEEMALLDTKLAVARKGQGQIVGITAEAGMGKSRLVAEAISLAHGQGFTGYGGECQSYGTNTPYLVWQAIWRDFFGLAASDALERQIEQVTYTIAELDRALLGRLPLLGPILNLPVPDNDLTRGFSPELRKLSSEAMLVDLLKARARSLGAKQQAMLLVLEDCHWLDAASHDLLEAIGRAIWNLPVLIVLAYRPPGLARLEAPRVSTLSYFTLLTLTELNEPEVADLIANRLSHLYPHEEQSPPTSFVAHLSARAEGNPFYLEELLNYLHDHGLNPYEVQTVERLELPTSLHSLILSRIDRLTEPQKATLKVASIIGRLFRVTWLLGYYPTLGEASEVLRDLDALSDLDLTPMEKPEPELVYLFKHIVTHEVAYESLPYATRARLHERLAAYLEPQDTAGVPGYLDLLAYHYALSENQSKAREYLRRAAEAAQAAYANGAAQSYYERLLPLLEEPEVQVEIHTRLGAVLELVGVWEKAEAHYQAALDLARATEQTTAQAQSTLALGKLCEVRGRYEEAQAWLLQAEAQWEALGEPGGRNQTLNALGVVAWRRGEYASAVNYLEQSRVLCQARGDQAGLAYAVINLGNAALHEGNTTLAQALYEEGLALRRVLDDKRGIAVCLNNLGDVATRQGRYAAAQALYEESLALWREMGRKQGIAICLRNLGNGAIHQGAYPNAQALLEESLSLCREMGDQQGIAICLRNLGLLAANQGNDGEGQTLLEESLALFREMGHKRGITIGLTNLGHVACRQTNEAAAHQHYRAALQLGQEIGAKGEIMRTLVGLATLATHSGAAEPLHQAARLLGAAETLRAALGQALSPMEQALYDEALAATR